MYAYNRTSHVFFTKEQIESWPDGHKQCKECGRVLPYHRFHEHRACLFGYNTVCKTCRVPRSQKSYSETSLEYRMWSSSRSRAKSKGIPFSIEITDIVIPERCPILGELMVSGSEYAPSLDRLVPDLGYVPGNVMVMSRRANTLKNNATIAELTAVLRFLRRKRM